MQCVELLYILHRFRSSTIEACDLLHNLTFHIAVELSSLSKLKRQATVLTSLPVLLFNYNANVEDVNGRR